MNYSTTEQKSKSYNSKKYKDFLRQKLCKMQIDFSSENNDCNYFICNAKILFQAIFNTFSVWNLLVK